MRKNFPVTQREITLSAEHSIVSTTDLKGNITYANPYFVEVSGFTLDELIGAPQNIVRHPDMPEAAFADLWATIRRGRPWRGMVKNRCKNGDYYWVMANVTPVLENGEPVGYMSVRTRPSRQEVAAAERLHAQMREQPGTVALRQGRAVHAGLRGRIDALARMRIATQANLLALVSAGGAAVLGATAASAWQAGLAGLVGLSGVLAWLLLRQRVLLPLRSATQRGLRLAGGDMSTQECAASDSEMGRLDEALRQVGINLRSVIGDVRSNFEQMRVATSELAQGNMDLSGRTEAQASNLEQTAASMEELARSIEDNTQQLVHASAQAEEAVGMASRGQASADQMLASMDAVASSSRQILDIIGIIEGIAFQTNILALNAAVEAARAGEQGRGFAVVAGEVRNLAARCSASAKDVGQLVHASIGRVDEGLRASREVGAQIHQVTAAIGGLKGTMQEIATAAQEQTRGVAQVNAAVAHLDGLTQQNAALVEQAAAATASLAGQTDGIADALAVFKLENMCSPGSGKTKRQRAPSRMSLPTGQAS